MIYECDYYTLAVLLFFYEVGGGLYVYLVSTEISTIAEDIGLLVACLGRVVWLLGGDVPGLGESFVEETDIS